MKYFLLLIDKITPHCLGIILAAYFLLPSTSYAQFSIGAELRPRMEFRDGYRTLPPEDSKPAFFISQRSRLNFSYAQKKFSLKFSFQDVRTWGDEELGLDVASTGLHEGYGQIQFNEQASLRIGRQELVYDDERLIGNSNWNQQARSFDAALFKYNSNGWNIDAAGAFNQQKENLFSTDYSLNAFKVLGFLHAGRSTEMYKAYAVLITDGFQGTDSTQELFMRYTYGANGEYTFKKIKWKGMIYAQSGMDKTNRAISAYLLSLQGHYQLKKLNTGAGLEFISGGDATDSTDEKIRTFNTLYATNHPLYGHQDYFENIPVDTRNGGLMDVYLKLNYAIHPKITGYIDYHYFRLAGNVLDTENGGSPVRKYLGSEIDLWFIYKFTDGLEIRPGISTMLATHSMDVIKGSNNRLTGYWAYVQVMFNPVLFRFDGKG